MTRAAKRLKITQPALTQQVHSLEKDLGIQLMEPSGRGIALTEAGSFFHKEAEVLLANLHNTHLKAKEIARGSSGCLRIGVTEGASFNPMLAAVLNKFRRKWPGVQTVFTQKQTPDLASDLRGGIIDVALMCPLPDQKGLRSMKLYAADMVLAVPCDHVLARRRYVRITDLKNEPLLLISHGNTEHSLESALLQACAKVSTVPRILQTVPEFMLALNLVASRVGITFVPSYMTNIHASDIAYRKMERNTGITMETVISVREDHTSAMIAHFSQTANEVFLAPKVSISQVAFEQGQQ